MPGFGAPPLVRKLKIITFTLAGNSFAWQLEKWKLNDNTEDGEKLYTFGAADATAEFREDAEPDYSLDMTYFSDWRSGGISDYLWLNDQVTLAFVLDHHPDISAEHVRWSGSLKIKAPTVGGDVRTTERTEVTFPVIGKPTYARIP
jgi:hypothetical protein